MKPRSVPKDTVWRGLYTAALFENDRSKIPARIAEAEGEIIKRARMLFGAAGDNAEEAEALDDALCMLRALKSCLRAGTGDRLAA